MYFKKYANERSSLSLFFSYIILILFHNCVYPMISTILLALLFLFIVFRRKIFPWLLLFFANQLMKSFQKKAQEAQQKPSKEPKAKQANKMGEYIDYEEIDWIN